MSRRHETKAPSRWPSVGEASVFWAGLVTCWYTAGLAADHARAGSLVWAFLDFVSAVVIVGNCWLVATREYQRRQAR